MNVDKFVFRQETFSFVVGSSGLVKPAYESQRLVRAARGTSVNGGDIDREVEYLHLLAEYPASDTQALQLFAAPILPVHDFAASIYG